MSEFLANTVLRILTRGAGGGPLIYISEDAGGFPVAPGGPFGHPLMLLGLSRGPGVGPRRIPAKPLRLLVFYRRNRRGASQIQKRYITSADPS